jgi:shikimate kinase
MRNLRRRRAGKAGRDALRRDGGMAVTSNGAGAPMASLKTPRTIVLVGLMGAGKSCIGRRLATRLGLPFIDADREIEEAAGCTIPEIFARHGEAVFRDGERRVIARLLTENPPHVLATGGGAFVDQRTRALIGEHAISIWLRASLELLARRVARRNDRPLLQVEDPQRRLAELMEQRYPVYAEADLTVDSADGPPEVTLERVLVALQEHLRRHPQGESRLAAAAVPTS